MYMKLYMYINKHMHAVINVHVYIHNVITVGYKLISKLSNVVEHKFYTCMCMCTCIYAYTNTLADSFKHY